MIVLVSGVNGFVGTHLAAELSKAGHTVHGIGTEVTINSRASKFVATYCKCDLTSRQAVAKLSLNEVDAVISLAGLASIGASFANPELYKRVNVGVLTSLCDRLVEIGSKARVIAISTGTVYDLHQPMPLTESSKVVAKSSPYTESKIMMEQAALEYKNQGLRLIIVRPFNHFGPGQLGGFLVPDLYQKLLSFKQSREPVKAGNLKTRRDYTDVRDVVRAYRLLATTDRLSTDTYNVCSGVSRAGKDVLEQLCHTMGIDKPKTYIDKSLLRPNDALNIVGSHDLLNADTGWQPEISFEQTIKDFVQNST